MTLISKPHFFEFDEKVLDLIKIFYIGSTGIVIMKVIANIIPDLICDSKFNFIQNITPFCIESNEFELLWSKASILDKIQSEESNIRRTPTSLRHVMKNSFLYFKIIHQ